MPEAVAAPQPPEPFAGRFYRAAAPVCAAWIGLAALHALLSRIFPGPAPVYSWLPPWVKAGWITTELSIGAVLLVVLAALRGLLGRMERRRPVLARSIWALAVFSVIFGLAASWSSHVLLGQFADLRSVEFAWTNGIRFLAYVHAMHPALLFLLPSGTAAATALLLWGGPRLLSRVPLPVRDRAVRIILVVAAACGLTAAAVGLFHGFASEGVRDPVTRAAYSWGRIYEARIESASGPLTHALGGVADALAPTSASPEVRRGSSRVVRRPQIAMELYVASVDRSKFRPRNVVLLLVDSMRPDALEAGGSSRPVVRTVDALAAGGTVFSDARTEASHTDYAAICPLSGQYPLRSAKVHRYPPKPPYPRVLLYDVLKAMGYRTALFSSQDEHWGQMVNYLETGGLDTFDHAYRPESRSMLQNFRRDDQTVDAAIRWVGDGGGKPFFLHVNLQNAHFPYSVPAEWPRRFGRKPDFAMSLGVYPPERVHDVRNLYADALAFVDAQIARLVDHLKARGLWSETIVVVLSDHGQAFLEHGFGGHASKIFDEVMKVPLIFHGPGVERAVDARPAELIDVPSSLCSLLGLPPHPAFQGIDLFAPDPPKERSRFMVVHTPLAMQFGVERGRWKLIHDEPLKLTSLYNLRLDPGETQDLSDAEPRILRELLRQATEWRELQLSYYRDPQRMATEYPPVLAEIAPR